MTVEQILQIVSYVVAGLAIVFSVIQFIYNKATGSKSKFLEKCLEFLHGLGTSASFAEKMTQLSDKEKKNVAMNYITMFCENQKIKFSASQLDSAVEYLVELTKTINAREKDLIEASNGLGGNTETDNAMLANDMPNIKSGDLV